MNAAHKYMWTIILSVLVIVLSQLFFVRYNMKSNLWLDGANKVIIEETTTRKNKNFIIDDPNEINNIKRLFENTKISYIYGIHYREYKITLTNGKKKKVYGYNQGNQLTDYGKSPGSLTLAVRIYKTDSSFESYIMAMLKEKNMDFKSLQKSMLTEDFK